MALSRKKNHAAIKAILAKVIDDTQWLTSPDGLDRIDDKGITPEGALRDVIVNVLHTAKDHKLDYRHIVLYAVLGFACECSTGSEEWKNLQPILDLVRTDAGKRIK